LTLIKDGWWQDTWWPSRWWQEDYWLEYGTAVDVVTAEVRGKKPPLRKVKVIHYIVDLVAVADLSLRSSYVFALFGDLAEYLRENMVAVADAKLKYLMRVACGLEIPLKHEAVATANLAVELAEQLRLEGKVDTWKLMRLLDLIERM